jgi:hypothetical protein
MTSWIIGLGIVALVGYVIDALFPQPSLKELVRAAERDPRLADVVRAAKGEPRTSASPLDGPARPPLARQGEPPPAPSGLPRATRCPQTPRRADS